MERFRAVIRRLRLIITIYVIFSFGGTATQLQQVLKYRRNLSVASNLLKQPNELVAPIPSPDNSLQSLSCQNSIHSRVQSVPTSLWRKRLLSQYVPLLAGGLAGAIASIITAPFDIIKVRLQASSAGTDATIRTVCREIYESKGVSGFFSGVGPTIFGIVPMRGTAFWCYSNCKKFLQREFGIYPNSSSSHLISAVFAGIISSTVSNPIWMVRTRLQIPATAGQKSYSGVKDVVSSIWEDEGLAGFFKGVTGAYWGASESCINFLMYEKLKTILSRYRASSEPSKAGLFVSAGISKLVASLATYPHEVAKTRLREQAVNGCYKYTGMVSTLKSVAVEEGWKGLYGGVLAHLLRVVPNNAVLFLSYELLTALVKHENDLTTSPNTTNV